MNTVNNWALLLVAGYLTVLTTHFLYAVWLIRGGTVDLRLGFAQTPWQILSSLLVLNGFSLSAFAWPERTWIWINFWLHVALTADEILRTAKARLRWPFLLNHILFAALLYLLVAQTN